MKQCAVNLEVSMSFATQTLNVKIINSAGIQTKSTLVKTEEHACLYMVKRMGPPSAGKQKTKTNPQSTTFFKTANTAKVAWPTQLTKTKQSVLVLKRCSLMMK